MYKHIVEVEKNIFLYILLTVSREGENLISEGLGSK
jgi:hypothetical protein